MKTRLLFLFIGCTVALPWLFTYAQQTQRSQNVRIKVEGGREIDLYDESHALVIGVSDYNNGWRKLPGVRTDVAEVSRVLKSQGFTTVTPAMDVTREEFDLALRSFISKYGLRERNRLVIYFAGHGHTERLSDDRDLGYIVMRNAPKPDSDPGGFSLASVSMDEINSYALRIKSKHALFVFDSCFSGTIFRSESEMRVPPDIASLTAAPVRQFITSGAAGQQVPDDSIFRDYFVRAFDQRKGDLNNDGFITGEELGKYLTGSVASDSRDTQTPRFGKIKDSKLNIGDLVFALPPKTVPPPVAPTLTPAFDPLAVELALWNSAQRNDEIADYEDYLRQYPNGRFGVAARNRIARLRAPVSAPVISNGAPATRISVTGAPLHSFDFQTLTVDANGRLSPKRTAQAWGFTESINGVPLEMVEIEAGRFLMGLTAGENDYDSKGAAVLAGIIAGRPLGEEDRLFAEGPQHQVTVKGFAIGKFEITQAQWHAVAKLPKVKIDLPADPAYFKGASLPVERVLWEEAVEFCARLSRLTGRTYRLPTEAEWEYAARAGTTTPFAFGATITPEIANYDGNSPYGNASKGQYREKTVPVGSLGAANPWGLFDMHGNVYEWCEDVWHKNYNGAPSDGSAWLSGGDVSLRALRGGSWNVVGYGCRSANRNGYAPDVRVGNIGFRVVSASRTRIR